MSASRTGPEMRIVRGEPSDEELAALTVVLGALADTAAHQPPERPSAWRDPKRRLHAPLHPGAGAWRAAIRQRAR